jgi:hypothetical protein
MTNVRKNLIATIDPGQGTTPLLVSLVGALSVFVGIALSGCALVGSGGTPGYTFSIIAGSLPTGLSLDPLSGAISGTPSAQGTFQFTAQITDAASNVFARTLTFKVAPQLFPLQTKATPATRGLAYRYQVLMADATGSTAGVSYSIVSGALPFGITLSSGGVISGTSVAAAGTYWFTVRGSKSGSTLDVVMSLVLREPVGWIGASLTIPQSLRQMTVGVPVSDQLVFDSAGATIGYPPFTWSISAGALPAGLTMDSRGRVSGVPTTATGSSYTQPTITLTDSAGQTRNLTPSGANTFNVLLSTKIGSAPGRVFVTDEDGLPTDVDFLAGFFGGGSDGDLTIDGSNSPAIAPLSGGYNKIFRDLYARNLTITGSGKLNLNGFRLFVSGTLDVSAAAANSIVDIFSPPFPSMGHWSVDGGNGGAGSTTNGAAGSSPPQPKFSACKSGGDGGDGGHGAGANLGGQGGFAVGPIQVRRPTLFHEPMLGLDPTNPTLAAGVVYAGIGGGGGGGGGGNNLSAGAAGTTGASGGGYVCIYARKINRSASTAAGFINVSGVDGANGANASGGSNQGGGGGGGGGSGGFVRIYYGELTGAAALGAIKANGGKGGNGGNMTGSSPATVGEGGGGGGGGVIVIGDLLQGITTIVDGTAGSAASGQTGGNGGTCVADL